MSGYFDLLPLLLAFFLPAVTMRLWAEERRHRTAEFLLTLPVTPFEAILGKYAAAMALYGLFLTGSLPIVAMLLALGSPDLGLIASGYLGLILLGSLFLAFGMFLSALTGDQIVAFITATLLGYFLVLTGNDSVVAVLDGLSTVLSPGTVLYDFVSVLPHYEAFVRGAVRLDSLVYFGGLTAVFLWMNARVLELQRT
jgi:ABC-2 type transport system permease protein